MDTMSISVKRPSLSEEAISRLIDPRTGTALRPLGVIGGRTVWPVMGAAPNDPSSSEKDDDDKDDDDKETKDDDDDPEGGSSSDEGGEGSDKGDPDAKIAALTEEKDRHVRRRREAEAERDRLRQELAEAQGKNGTDDERTQNRLTELETENETLTSLVRETRLENAFLKDNTYTWHNPGRALALADLSDVEIDSDGSVHGLTSALDKLAKSDAYLLKTEGTKDKGKEQPSTSTTKSKSSKDKTKDEAKDEELRKKYSALRR